MKIQPLLVYFYNMNSCIYIARSHKNALLDEQSVPEFVPILNGAANAVDDVQDKLRDDIGFYSISGKANVFKWLTSLYWIWKNENIDDNDIVGFYNEDMMLLDNFTAVSLNDIKFMNDGGNPNKDIRLSKSQLLDAKPMILNDLKKLKFSHYDIVASRAHFTIPVLPVRQCWGVYHDEKLFDEVEKMIQSNFKSYHSAFKEIAASSSPMLRENVFIMRGKNLKSYCEFLFGILIPVSSTYDIAKEMEKRDFLQENHVISEFDFACFYEMSKILFSVWIMKNHLVCMDKWNAVFV